MYRNLLLIYLYSNYMTTFYSSNTPTEYKPKLQTYYRPIYSSPLVNSSIRNAHPFSCDQVSKDPLTSDAHANLRKQVAEDKTKSKGLDSGNLRNERSTDFFIISKENRIENPTSFYGCFYLGPFGPGQGITIGNALRRTLLSSIPSYAITSVEIEGVSHEYSSIPGVKETVLDILLALNETVLTSRTSWKDKKVCIGYLKKQGPGIVYARDFRLPPEFECVNPNQYIATLSDNGYLNLKFQIQYGSHWAEIKGQNWYNPMKRDDTNSMFHDSLLNTLPSTDTLIEQPWPTIETDDSVSVKENSATTKTSLRASSELKSFTTQTTLQKLVNYAEKRENLTRSETLPLLLNPNFSPIRKINYVVEVSPQTSFDPNLPHLRGPRQASSNANTEPTDHINEFTSSHEGSFISSNELYKNQRNFVELFKTKVSSEIVILEIWTNGSLHPRTALSKAVQHCATTFSKLGQIVF